MKFLYLIAIMFTFSCQNSNIDENKKTTPDKETTPDIEITPFIKTIPYDGPSSKGRALEDADPDIKDLKLLAKGRGNNNEWALYLAPKAKKQTNLALIIKNTGAKFIDLKGLEAKHFSVKQLGKSLTILRISGLENISYQSVTIGQIVLDGDVTFDKESFFEMLPKKSALVKTRIYPVNISASSKVPK